VSNISAIVTLDGEVIPASDFGSEKEFEFKVLNSLNFETIQDFFIKKITTRVHTNECPVLFFFKVVTTIMKRKIVNTLLKV
jgi:hypothetical protein